MVKHGERKSSSSTQFRKESLIWSVTTVWICEVGRNVKDQSFFEAQAMVRLHLVMPSLLCLLSSTNVFEV